MTELPDELRALLDLTRDAHEPTDAQAKVRVRQAVAASLLIGATASSSSLLPPAAASNTQTIALASKSGWALLGSKVTTFVVGAVAAAGLGIAAYQLTRTPSAPPARTVVPQSLAPKAAEVQALPPSVEPVVAPSAVPAEEPVEVEKVKHTPKAKRSTESLSAETALLRAASEALARGDEAAALVSLREHARRFPDGSLREERDGLRAIAECTRDEAPSDANAKRFAKQYPSSLLGARVAKACTRP